MVKTYGHLYGFWIALVFYIIFAADFTVDRDFWTWVWLLAGIKFFIYGCGSWLVNELPRRILETNKFTINQE